MFNNNRYLGGPFHITAWKSAPTILPPSLWSLWSVQMHPVCREHRLPRRSALYKPSFTLGATAESGRGGVEGCCALRMFRCVWLAVADTPRAATWKGDPVVMQRARSAHVTQRRHCPTAARSNLACDSVTHRHRETHPYLPLEKR